MDKPAFICGIVEGFYGRPWTVEQRKELFKRMNKLGLNTYMYAPKDDTKHRTYWRDLYSNEEIDCLTKLIKCAKENHINFYYSLSPGLNITFSKSKDIDAIKKKMDQVAKFGCTSFALLFDDIDVELSLADKQSFKSFAHAQAHVTNEIYEHLNKPNFMFCPTEYCVCRAVPDVKSSEYLRTLGDLLDPAIGIMWTGPRVVSKTVTRTGLEELKSVLANRNPLILWDNIHANDYDPKRVFLGPFSGRDGDIVASADRPSADSSSADRPLDGVLSNPNCEFEANFVAIHTLAQWSNMACGGRAIKNLENGSPESREIVKEIAEISVATDPSVLSTTKEEDTNVGAKEMKNEVEQKQTIASYDPKEALMRALKDWLPHVNSRTPYLLQVPRCLTTVAPSADSFPRLEGYHHDVEDEVENGGGSRDHYGSATSLFSAGSSSSTRSSTSLSSLPGLEPATSGSGTKLSTPRSSSDSSLPKPLDEMSKKGTHRRKKKPQIPPYAADDQAQQHHKSFMQRYHAVERSYYVLPSLHMQPVNSLVEKMRDENLNLDVIENAVAPNVVTDLDTEMFNNANPDNIHSKEFLAQLEASQASPSLITNVKSTSTATEPMAISLNMPVVQNEATTKETKPDLDKCDTTPAHISSITFKNGTTGSERMDCSVPALEMIGISSVGGTVVVEDREKPLSELQPCSTLHQASSQQHVTVLANLSPTQGLECDMEFERVSKGAWDYYKAQALSDAVQASASADKLITVSSSQNESSGNHNDLIESKSHGLEMKIHYETFEPMQIDNSTTRPDDEPLTPPSTPAGELAEQGNSVVGPISNEHANNNGINQNYQDYNEGGISKLLEFQASHHSVFEPMDHYAPVISDRFESDVNDGRDSARTTIDIGGILKERLSVKGRESSNYSSNTQTLTLEDALLLSDLFYLPFEHGRNAQQLLDDFHWLKSNALTHLSNAPPHLREIWMERCSGFERFCDSVCALCTKLTRVRNKAVLFELFPYVWDLKGVVTLVKGFARWLALGAFPQRPLSSATIAGSGFFSSSSVALNSPALDNFAASTNLVPESNSYKKEPESNFRAQLAELMTERYSWNAYYGKGFSMVAKSTLATINNFAYGTSVSSNNSPETTGVNNNNTISVAQPHTQSADEPPSPPQLENIPILTDTLPAGEQPEATLSNLAEKNEKTEVVKSASILSTTPTEPTILRGGLQAEFHRMLPLDTCIDLFCHRPPYPPVRTQYSIRPYRAATDEAPVYEVCRQTFDDGCDSSNLFPNKPDLPGDFLVGGFLTLTPTTCFVLEDNVGLCGYILCAPDSKVYLDRLELSWIPELKAKYLTASQLEQGGQGGLVEKFLDDYQNPPAFFKGESTPPELMDEGSRSSPGPKLLEHSADNYNCTPPTFAEEYICGRIKNYTRYLPPKLLQHYPSLVQFAFLPRVDDFSIPKRMLACLMSVIKLYGSTGLYACVPVKHKNEQDFYIKLLGFYELTMLEEYPPEAIVLGRAFY